MSTPLEEYLAHCNGKPNAAMTAYVANLQQVASVNPSIAADVVKELATQRAHLKLVASENYCSLAVQAAMGNLLTDKYAEGYPEHRYYGGCVNVDSVEMTAAREAEQLFGADYAYVQPHSGADTNLVAYWAILSAKVETPTLEELGAKSLNDLTAEQFDMLRHRFGNQKLMGLDYSCGGHLTHGYKMNVSARMFESHPYGVDKETGLLD
ncbi:MAG: glycine hydroxymethyltransferase, partial [Spirochaetaceae bacterium]|nr:glycine hydroxymethyltransferase [Spirochaetaceae bacterium]